VTVRWATVEDIDELVRLRRVMFEAMGVDVTAAVDDAVAGALRRGLPSGEVFAAVVDGPDRSYLAACGVGLTSVRLPGPHNPSGGAGYIQSMATDPRARRQGHARAVLTLLLERFRELDVRVVELHATAAGEPLYRSAGFGEAQQLALQWRL
jgi:ribosomal protein S18 acetylase RimI-like enzyme